MDDGDKKELDDLREEVKQVRNEVRGLRERIRVAFGHLRRISRGTSYEELVEILKLVAGQFLGGGKDGGQVILTDLL